MLPLLQSISCRKSHLLEFGKSVLTGWSGLNYFFNDLLAVMGFVEVGWHGCAQFALEWWAGFASLLSEALWLELYPWCLVDLLSLIWSVLPNPLITSSTLYHRPASHYYCWYLYSTSNLWSSFFKWFLREIIGCSSDCFARLFYGD